MSVIQQAHSQIESILIKLNINFRKSGSWLTAPCSVHQGDNRGALAFCTRTNKWVCFTRHCQQEYGNDIVGLVAGVLDVSRTEALGWLEENVQDVDISAKRVRKEKEDRVYEEFFTKKLLKTDFYLRRGFSEATVNSFEHGMANALSMRNRVVFPIRDEIGLIRGFSGRWAGKEIEVERQDKKKMVCVTESGVQVPKWRHTSFKKTNYCYRLKEARQSCQDELIVVESIGNVMRFYDSGFTNCIACMGSYLSFRQANLIIGSTKKAILAFDNDKAGKQAETEARKLLQPYMNLKTIWTPEGMDWGEMKNQELLELWNKNK